MRRSTAPKQAVWYVNLTLRFFSIQLFLGRRDRTLYSREYKHPHRNRRLEKRYFPFGINDQYGTPSHYTNHAVVQVSRVTQFFHEGDEHINFVKQFTLALLKWKCRQFRRTCPCANQNFMRQFKNGNVFDFPPCKRQCYDSSLQFFCHLATMSNYNLTCTRVHRNKKSNDYHPQDWTDHRKKAHAITSHFTKVRSLNGMLTSRKNMSEKEHHVWFDKENRDMVTGYCGEDEWMRFITVHIESKSLGSGRAILQETHWSQT